MSAETSGNPFHLLTDTELAAMAAAPGPPLIAAAYRAAVVENLKGLRDHAAILAQALGPMPPTLFDEGFEP